MKTFIVTFTFTREGEKKNAHVTHFKIHANNRDEAMRLVAESNPAGVTILRVKEA